MQTRQSVLSSYRSRFTTTAPPRTTQNLRTVTAKQLITACQQRKHNGRFMLNNGQIYTVRVCGRIISIDQNDGYTDFQVDDGTGLLQSRIWSLKSDGKTDLTGSQLGAYYEVVANLNVSAGQILLQSIKTAKVEDPNMITMRMLAAIAEECDLTMHTNIQFKQWHEVAEESRKIINTSFTTELDKESVIMLLTQPAVREMEHGASTKQIGDTLHLDYSRCREVLELMLNEGSIYNTIDYEHFKLADNN